MFISRKDLENLKEEFDGKIKELEQKILDFSTTIKLPEEKPKKKK